MLRGLQPQTMTSHPCLVAPLKMENSSKGGEARVKVKNQFIVPSSSFLLFTVKMDVALLITQPFTESEAEAFLVATFSYNLVFFEKINILFRKAINPVSYYGKKNVTKCFPTIHRVRVQGSAHCNFFLFHFKNTFMIPLKPLTDLK